MVLFCCASELGPPEDLSAIEVILYYYYYYYLHINILRLFTPGIGFEKSDNVP